MYSFGSGSFGQLGHGDNLDQRYPKLIERLSGYFIVDAKAGLGHTILLTRNGRVFTFGINTVFLNNLKKGW